MPSDKLMSKLGLKPEDFQPKDEVAQLREDTNTLADTVLALCDIIEGGAADGVE